MSTRFVDASELTWPRQMLTFHWPSDVLMSGVVCASKAIGESTLALHYIDGTIEVGEYNPELKEGDSVFMLTMTIQEQRYD